MDVFDALADPQRRRMLDLLAERPRSAGDLGAAFPQLTQPAVSRHLRILRDVQLVAVQVAAQRRVYRLAPEGFGAAAAWFDRYHTFWSDRLARLDHHVHHPKEPLI